MNEKFWKVENNFRIKIVLICRDWILSNVERKISKVGRGIDVTGLLSVFLVGKLILRKMQIDTKIEIPPSSSRCESRNDFLDGQNEFIYKTEIAIETEFLDSLFQIY